MILFIGIMLCWSVGLNNYYKGRDFHILAQIDPWREAGNFLTGQLAKNDLVIVTGNSGPLNYYYSGNHEPFANSGDEAFEKLMDLTNNKKDDDIWFVVSDPRYKAVAERVKGWLDRNYILVEEKKYLHDPEYLTKSKFFNKDFFEYRISIYKYKPGKKI